MVKITKIEISKEKPGFVLPKTKEDLFKFSQNFQADEMVANVNNKTRMEVNYESAMDFEQHLPSFICNMEVDSSLAREQGTGRGQVVHVNNESFMDSNYESPMEESLMDFDMYEDDGNMADTEADPFELTNQAAIDSCSNDLVLDDGDDSDEPIKFDIDMDMLVKHNLIEIVPGTYKVKPDENVEINEMNESNDVEEEPEEKPCPEIEQTHFVLDVQEFIDFEEEIDFIRSAQKSLKDDDCDGDDEYEDADDVDDVEGDEFDEDEGNYQGEYKKLFKRVEELKKQYTEVVDLKAKRRRTKRKIVKEFVEFEDSDTDGIEKIKKKKEEDDDSDDDDSDNDEDDDDEEDDDDDDDESGDGDDEEDDDEE